MINSPLLILLFFLFTFNAFSKNIIFQGLNKLSLDDLQNITSLDISNNNFSNEDLDTMLKELYNSDLIYDLELSENDDHYILSIEENKIIQDIFISNNVWVDDKSLLDVLLSKRNTLFSKDNLVNDINIINNIYRSKGFHDVSTVAKFESFSNNRINLIFDIFEGKQSKLKLIKFTGNSVYSDKFLSSKINSKSVGLNNIFTSGSNFNPDIFNFDKNSLKNFYYDNGYLDINISYSIEKNNFGLYTLNFFIDEGRRYTLNEINYDTDLNDFKPFKKMYSNFKVQVDRNNKYYSKEIINSFLEEINLALMMNNVNNYYVESNLKIEDELLKLNLNKKSQYPTNVNTIKISGNSITKDRTIRSRLLIEPGDIYNQYLINRSEENLAKYSYIKDVNITSDFNSGVDLTVDINEEKKTGNILLAGTFNTDTDFGLNFGIEDKNFLGSGNIINANFDINTENVKFNVDYTQFPLSNPYLSNTYSIVNQEKDLSSSFGYKLTRRSLGYKLNFSQDESISYGIGVKIDNAKGHSPKEDSVSSISDSIGNFDNISFSFNLNKDTTNNFFNPTDGNKNNLYIQISPSGISDDPFYKLILLNKNYYKLKNSDNYFFFNNNLGYAKSINSKLKTINTFSLGGSNFRGFDFRGIGPKDGNVYLGANQYFTSTLGYGSSFIFDEKDNINIKIFSTIGSLWDSDYSNTDFDLRSSAGISLDFINLYGIVIIQIQILT